MRGQLAFRNHAFAEAARTGTSEGILEKAKKTRPVDDLVKEPPTYSAWIFPYAAIART